MSELETTQTEYRPRGGVYLVAGFFFLFLGNYFRPCLMGDNLLFAVVSFIYIWVGFVIARGRIWRSFAVLLTGISGAILFIEFLAYMVRLIYW
jgi:hypothetical protein